MSVRLSVGATATAIALVFAGGCSTTGNDSRTSSDAPAGKLLGFTVTDESSSGQDETVAFFAAILPVSSPQEYPKRIPKPVPDSGYTLVQLHDPDGDSTYRAESKLTHGRYMVVFFAAEGVRNTRDGNYPTMPAQLVRPDEWDAVKQAVIPRRRSNVTIAAQYSGDPPAASSTTSVR